MPDIGANGGIGGGVNGAGGADGLSRELKSVGNKADAKAFDEAMSQAINEVTQIQQSADKATQDLANGGDMTQAIIEMQKADLNFQLMIDVRNRILNAYDQIMGMQI
ncbi:MAG: flagellar hook-basal body complex protein FliE [Nitrospiraceae bacterium]|nr:flagellar hook-basal body complex protein FliE [Nitrospiraceae bacterium]